VLCDARRTGHWSCEGRSRRIGALFSGPDRSFVIPTSGGMMMTQQIEFWRSPQCGQRLRAVRSDLTVVASLLLGLGLVTLAEARPGVDWVAQAAQQRIDSQGAAQSGQDVRPLELGKPIERELAGGQ